ncbi:hypothetical protein [Paenibacillus eucommiae]|uniref:Uncharacterized protein n=1 Tax=Paenibacillus eucommiae TaxID=1355755 RepID=A0ABS4IPZ5_9BACL|nr:hypothetical protein [Paenibacillus eucommiae]MBP1989634.1 hypothetical protein [Paenibacillus eucommiae]
MDMENYKKMLIKRTTDCITYHASPGPSIENCTSWISGNTSDFFDDKSDLIIDHSYLFGYGALYVFAKITTNEIQDPVAGFWQFS